MKADEKRMIFSQNIDQIVGYPLRKNNRNPGSDPDYFNMFNASLYLKVYSREFHQISVSGSPPLISTSLTSLWAAI